MPPLSSRRLARFACAPIAAFLLFPVAPPPVSAHAELVEASPEPNGALVVPPTELRITFSEPIDETTSTLRVVDATQLTVEGVGPMELVDGGTTVVVDLPELDPGVYTVAYQVVSTVDGHATAGSYAFLIDPSGSAPPPTDTATFSSPSVDPFTVIARWTALAMLLVAFGSVVMWWNAGRGGGAPPWGLIGLTGLLGAGGVLAYLALSARPIDVPAATAGAEFRLPFDIAAGYGWTPFAIAMRIAALGGVAVAALSAVAARFWLREPVAAAIALVLLAAALAGMSFAGHAASIGGPLFAGIDWLHLLAAGAWLGGLPAAFVLARRRSGRAPRLREMLRRHGRIGLVAGPVVVVTGIANSPIVLGSGRDLVASDYGNLVLAKAALVGVALGIGAVNHLALRGRGRAAVVGLVAAELVVAAVAVGVAATMVTIQPAAERRAELRTTEVNPAHFFGEAGGARVHLAVSVPAPGDQAYRVLLTDPDTGGPPGDVQRVFLAFTPPAGAAAQPMRVELAPETGDLTGLYVANGPFTPLVGEWALEVILRRAGERDVSVGFAMVVTTPGTPELGPPPDTGIGVPTPIAAAWSLVPSGPLAWAPALVAGAALIVLGRLRRSAWRSIARGAVVTLLVAAVGVAGTRSLVEAANAPSADELASQPRLIQDADPSRGESVYLANCASCHGVRLDGDGPVQTVPDAGPLEAAVEAASDAELSYRIAYGIAGTPMPAFAGLLTPDERADLIAYLRQAADDE